MTFDTLYDELQRDLLRLDAEDRAFARYILLSNQYNKGICPEQLDVDRQGLNKLVNMLSTEARVAQARPIDSNELLYRIDIRQYGWDRPIEVNGTLFDDGWEAIAEANPYAVAFEGDEAEAVAAFTQTSIPWMYGDSLTSVASIGNLYYSLLDIDVNDTLDSFIANDLNIDVAANLDQEELVRAGTTRSLISQQDRVVERHDLGVRQGAFWQSFDFAADEAEESIFEDPFGFAEGGREAIFTLPNGLLAFAIADENDAFAETSNLIFDRDQNDFVARTSVSCSGCHAQGFLNVEDEVRRVVESNPLQYDADEYQSVLRVYPLAQDFQRIVEEDSTNYQRALAQGGIALDSPDPVSGVFLSFERDVTLDSVAGDLGVTRELLNQNISLLDPAVQVLRDGLITLDRDDFTNVFVASLCVMQVASQNRPNAAACEQALAELDN